MECLAPYDTKFSFKGTNRFHYNYASNSGGAIFWNDVQPVLFSGAKNDFKDNKATVYADDIGSYPQKLVKLTKE